MGRDFAGDQHGAMEDRGQMELSQGAWEGPQSRARKSQGPAQAIQKNPVTSKRGGKGEEVA